jgi:hypothetical protein
MKMPTKCSNCGNEVGGDMKTCPQCGGEAGGRLHVFRMLGGIAIGLCLVSLVGQLGPPSAPPAASGKSAATTNAAGELPGFSVTAQEMAMAYETNTAAAGKRFENSRFSVSGTIATIDNTVPGRSLVVLDGGRNRGAHPQAILSESEKAKAAGLAAGTPISMVCTGGDAATAPLMKNCVIKP